MKYSLLTPVFIGLTIISFGQDLKTKKKKVEEREGTATFHVLANNETIKQGAYQIKAYTGSRILLKGNYDNNKKVGLWQEQYYGKEYKGPKASGMYDNDKRVGNWVYFNYAGDTALIYNWTENKIVSSNLCGTTSREYTIIENGKESKSQLDCPPTAATGPDYFLYEFTGEIGEKSDYFKKVGNDLYKLQTKISILIDETASVVEVSFSTEERNELKEIIERYIRSYKWIPGKKDGKDVAAKLEFGVSLSSQF